MSIIFSWLHSLSISLSISISINLLIVYNKTPLLFGKDIRVNLYFRGLFITRFRLYVLSCILLLLLLLFFFLFYFNHPLLLYSYSYKCLVCWSYKFFLKVAGLLSLHKRLFDTVFCCNSGKSVVLVPDIVVSSSLPFVFLCFPLSKFKCCL